MNKPLIIFLGIVGFIFLVCSIIYFIEPAKSLPTFFPGYDSTLSKHHVTHGIGMLILACAAFVIAWFQSGKKSSHEEKKRDSATN